MIRWTCELIPYGIERQKRTIGMIEIGNNGTGDQGGGNYSIILKKNPPWKGVLKEAWRKGELDPGDFSDIIISEMEGFDRLNRGVYDLLYLALVACNIHHRNEKEK